MAVVTCLALTWVQGMPMSILNIMFIIVIPGSEIPKWFSHQKAGAIVNAQVTHPNKNLNIQVPSHSCNKWIGMAVCTVINYPNFHPNNYVFSNHLIFCNILVNKHEGATIVYLFSTKFV